jgi:transposase
MPKLLAARPPVEAVEERYVRQLARSHHAPADWVLPARMIVRSWEGLRTAAIAKELDCHPQTVRERFHAFTARGLDGLGMKPGSGRTPRLTQAERSAVIALVASPPPGRLVRSPEGTREPADSPAGDVADWSLDALAAAAQAQGIHIGRSQVRRILRQEGVRWRRTHAWGTSTAKGAKDFAPKGRRSSPAPPTRPRAQRPAAWTHSAPSSRAPSPQPRAGRRTATGSRRP